MEVLVYVWKVLDTGSCLISLEKHVICLQSESFTHSVFALHKS